MIVRAQFKGDPCGPGEISLVVYHERVDEKLATVKKEYQFTMPDFSNFDGDLEHLFLIPSQAYALHLKAWWNNKKISKPCCTSSSDLALEALKVSNLEFTKSFFSTSFCCNCCLIPTCGCNSPYQVFNIISEIALSQMAVSEEWFNKLTSEMNESVAAKDGKTTLTKKTLPQLIQTLEAMGNFLREKAKSWDVKTEAKVNETIDARISQNIDKLTRTKIAIDQAAFIEFEKKFEELINKEMKEQKNTNPGVNYLKAKLINHLMTRNKTMQAFLKERAMWFAQTSPVQSNPHAVVKPPESIMKR